MKNQVEQIKDSAETLTFKLKRKAATGEWVVRVYVDGVYSEDRSYYTDDKKNAEDTLRLMSEYFEANKPSLDALVAKHTEFATMQDMVEAKGGYRPTIYVNRPAMLRIADAYDAIQEFLGDSRRAYRVNA